jgi:hypothetical protein
MCIIMCADLVVSSYVRNFLVAYMSMQQLASLSAYAVVLLMQAYYIMYTDIKAVCVVLIHCAVNGALSTATDM